MALRIGRNRRACAECWLLGVLLLACNVDQRQVGTLMLGGCSSGSCTEPVLPDGGSGGTLSGAAGASGLVLELLEGRSLEGIPAVRRRIGAAEAAWVGARVCEALAAAHRRGIIHRDIKPSNVFVARDEQGSEVIKIFDFGVARIPSQVQAASLRDSALSSLSVQPS